AGYEPEARMFRRATPVARGRWPARSAHAVGHSRSPDAGYEPGSSPDYRLTVRRHPLAADLNVEAVRILDVEAVRRVGPRLQASPFEFGFDGILVPVLDRVRDVIDFRRRRSLTRVAWEQPRALVAERQIALTARVLQHL